MIVYKYPLQGSSKTPVYLPAGARVVRIAFQQSLYGQGPMLWALVPDLRADPVRRHFWTAATGESVPDHSIYLGSWESPSGEIYHTFEIFTEEGARALVAKAGQEEPLTP